MRFFFFVVVVSDTASAVVSRDRRARAQIDLLAELSVQSIASDTFRGAIGHPVRAIHRAARVPIRNVPNPH